MHAGRHAADAPHGGEGGNAHNTKEGPVHRHHDTRRQRGGLCLAIYRNDTLKEAGELVGQSAGIGALDVVAVIDGEIDLLNAYLQHIARRGAIDENWTGQNVRTGAAIRDLPTDSSHIFRHCTCRNNAGCFDDLRIKARHTFDGDDVSRIDAQHRLRRGAEVADMHGLWIRHERVFGCRREWRRQPKQQ